jgi:hypothetical protein
MQVYALLDQMAAAVGLAATPEFQWVYFLAGALARVAAAALACSFADALTLRA